MKTFTCTLILILFTLVGIAQEEETTKKEKEVFQPKTFIGLKGAYQVSRMVFDPTVKQDWFSGVNTGFVFKHQAERGVGIQIEVNYSIKGWKNQKGIGKDYTRKMECIEIPLMTHIEIGKKRKFMVNLGPYLSYLLNDQEAFSWSADTRDTYVDKPIDNNLEYGLSLGLGFLQESKFGDFAFEGRVNQTLSNSFDAVGSEAISRSQIQTIQVALFYYFPLKR